ncbi:high affinity cAMP-specific and IBMX-insensitive 3',5'-cyclic phosphodiesterase 8B isoform X1 [Lingula anatina]|uniref:Phosphodiesterase n=1 Tax=Lingula anatina TaxID=7574 RepID=A0A1S3ICL9_LINAN|nr:high affinity cAMP-specific and IBMX-insensitive 3',5'-cyclic phosphodiesterase 8B isoform X1 [Lingula anatina]|eukprot:XP_013396005.1 high affinity cAMP-specific and IBMX-insensitive 3',5'-cyclic phosphodiesterase 8B isoform X1 [Lingula anatina]
MGCAPSLHSTRTGVLLCKDAEDSNSAKYSSSQAQSQFQVIKTESHSDQPSSGTISFTSSSNKSKVGPSEMVASMSLKEHTEHRGKRLAVKVSESELTFGPMRLKQHTMSILLVFGKDDGQSDSFWFAADKAGYKCNLARNSETALDIFLDKHPDVVVIDHRHSKHFDAETLCRSIRATKASKYTILIAVTKKTSSDREEAPILPLLQAGFNRRFIENHNVGTCLNELVSIEHGELRSQLKLRACDALFAALEHSSDAIEITSKDHIVQYVNPAYESMLGYTLDELLGKDIRKLPNCEKNNAEHQENVFAQLKKGKSWEGTCYAKKKTGESLCHHCHILPVEGGGGKIRHYVAIRNPAPENCQLDRYHRDCEHSDHHSSKPHDYRSQRKGSCDMRSISSSDVCHLADLFWPPGGHIHSRRRDSAARIHSMTIEAPINKVINIINAAQENSPLTVVQALDKVLEILRTTELYSPHLTSQQVREEDQMTSDLVGGLMSSQGSVRSAEQEQGTTKRRMSSTDKFSHHSHIPQQLPATMLSQVPADISRLLETEPQWEFNILELERLTNRRPLAYLAMKTFTRFNVCEFLNTSETTMWNWLQLIEAKYHSSNKYHNSTHAADVMQSTAYFLERQRIKSLFDHMDEVASLIAAVVHDVDHPGKTNAFLVNAGNDLALVYNDLAVLESHHVSLAFRLSAQNDDVNIFKNLERDDFRAMRQMIIDMVLATELTKHFEHLSKFVNCTKHFVEKEEEDFSLNGSQDAQTTLSLPENKAVIKRMIIKCSDVSNPARPFYLCKEWALRIAEEYFQQTDEEKSLGLPVVMPVFDRKTCSIPKSQISFIDFFINEMFEAWDDFADVPDLIGYLQENYRCWQTQQKEEQDKQQKQSSTEQEDGTESEQTTENGAREEQQMSNGDLESTGTKKVTIKDREPVAQQESLTVEDVSEELS